LRYLVNREDCRWLSATNADNIYGVEVVERVRNAVSYPSIYKNKHPFYQTVPDIVIAPLDSRNWAEIGKEGSSLDVSLFLCIVQITWKGIRNLVGTKIALEFILL
jgi:hypothetical protein